jgi:putative heme-binding domain-containing protein
MTKVWLGGIVVVGLCWAQGGATNPFANDSRAAADGRPIFRLFCSPCHGIKAEGGRGPDLTRGVYSAGESDADLFNVIANGATGTEMPEFQSRLGDENIWRLIAYIRSVTKRDSTPVTGDRQLGEKLFWAKGQCGACHMVGTKGGRMGPELTRIGRTRSAAYLRESIVDINADLTPGFFAITVVTKDGKKIVGVQRGFDNFSAQLMDVGEKFYSFQKSDVTSMKREFRSLMPDNYSKMFSDAELNDLVAYLAGLRGPEEKR